MCQLFKRFFPLTFVYLNLLFSKLNCIEFNRNLTGVFFQPYVRNSTAHSFTTYNIDELKIMMKVISGKFSKVLTLTTSNTASYRKNYTYLKTFSEVRTLEAAALINRESISKNDSANLGVYIGIYLSLDPIRMNTEIKLAFEAVHKSNNIHPGTSIGLVISHSYVSRNISFATLAISESLKLRNEAKSLNLTIGIKTYCYSYKNTGNTSDFKYESLEQKRIDFLLNFDFIICEGYANDFHPSTLLTSIDVVSHDVVKIRDSMNLINPNIEFMVEAKFRTLKSFQTNFQYQLDYWKMMDQWATKNNIFVWMYEAFDNPWRQNSYNLFDAQFGWWKLKDDQYLTSVDSYKEKVGRLNFSDKSSTKFTEQHNSSSYTSNVTSDSIAKPGSVPNEHKPNDWLISSIIFCSITALLSILFLVAYFLRRNNSKNVLSNEELDKFMNGRSANRKKGYHTSEIEMKALHAPYNKSIEKQKNSFEINWSTILGFGEFGVVYKANIKENQQTENVALKMTKEGCPKSAVLSILVEIKILSFLGHHKNVVSIKGAYTAEIAKGVVYVATDLCELGSLKNFLRKMGKREPDSLLSSTKNMETNKNIIFNDLVKWSYDIACGMEFIARKNVIHADLATRNVLLTADKTAKITDFGLSRRLYEFTSYVKKKQEPLPWRWMAIEALRKSEFSSQSDVWSFGVTLWETFSMADIPYPGVTWSMNFVDDLDNGMRMKSPRLASSEIYKLMASCWEQYPQNRPTFTQLKEKIWRINA